jgi:hypothetical protein
MRSLTVNAAHTCRAADWLAAQRTTSDDAALDLIVSTRDAGLEVISHLQPVIAACR